MERNEAVIKILKLLKLDLGITHGLRDEYFTHLLISSISELERKGISFDSYAEDDQFLVMDYAAWNYRKRQENVSLPINLQMRIRSRILRARANIGAVN